MTEPTSTDTEIRSLDDLRHTDTLVRKYSVPSGDYLYAYRTKDNTHIVVAKGTEPDKQWTKQTPATVTRPIPGQTLWTLPDNWTHRVTSTRDKAKHGLFYISESDVWALVFIPTNDWLNDASYHVKRVGDLTVDPVGELGNSLDIRRLADEYEEAHSYDGFEVDAEAIREVANNWGVVEEDLRRTTEWVRDDGLDEKWSGDALIHADRDWQIKFREGRVFRPEEVINYEVDLSEYNTPVSVIMDVIQDAGLFPSYYKFELGVDQSAVRMQYFVRGLVELGVSPAEAIDYYMVEVEGMTQTTWADERSVDQSTVSGNVSQAKQKLKHPSNRL